MKKIKIKNITSDVQADAFFKGLGLEKEEEKSLKAQFSELKGKVSKRKVLDFLKRNPILMEKFLRFSIEDKDCGDEKLNRLESTHPQVVEQIYLLIGSSGFDFNLNVTVPNSKEGVTELVNYIREKANIIEKNNSFHV